MFQASTAITINETTIHLEAPQKNPVATLPKQAVLSHKCLLYLQSCHQRTSSTSRGWNRNDPQKDAKTTKISINKKKHQPQKDKRTNPQRSLKGKDNRPQNTIQPPASQTRQEKSRQQQKQNQTKHLHWSKPSRSLSVKRLGQPSNSFFPNAQRRVLSSNWRVWVAPDVVFVFALNMYRQLTL